MSAIMRATNNSARILRPLPSFGFHSRCMAVYLMSQIYPKQLNLVVKSAEQARSSMPEASVVLAAVADRSFALRTKLTFLEKRLENHKFFRPKICNGDEHDSGVPWSFGLFAQHCT